MISSSRNLLVLFKTNVPDEKAVEKQLDCLNDILREIESAEQFTNAHELVDRNCITSNKKKIFKASLHFRLKPFRFLINKN